MFLGCVSYSSICDNTKAHSLNRSLSQFSSDDSTHRSNLSLTHSSESRLAYLNLSLTRGLGLPDSWLNSCVISSSNHNLTHDLNHSQLTTWLGGKLLAWLTARFMTGLITYITDRDVSRVDCLRSHRLIHESLLSLTHSSTCELSRTESRVDLWMEWWIT